MRQALLIAITVVSAAKLTAQRPTTVRQPVFDAHFHWPFNNVQSMIAAMDSLNVVRAVAIGSSSQLDSIPATMSARLIPALPFPCERGLMPNAGAPCYPTPGQLFPDTAWLRRQVTAGRIQVFGEIGAQYLGIAPDDPRLEPYWTLAEELDVPVGIHLGIGPPGVSYADTRMPPFKSPNYRGAAGDPYALEDVLVRHPKLRLYVMHAAWPDIPHMLYMMCMHPRLYVDVGGLQYVIARPAYLAALKTLTDAGLGERIMFGSDGGARFLAMGVDAIDQASFLTDKQKRDILHDNAMRFFRVGPQPPPKQPRTCGEPMT